jgi:hypothetical protein
MRWSGSEGGVDRSSGHESQVVGRGGADGVDLFDEACGLRAEMQEIRVRHWEGLADPHERRRFLVRWQALALRRSPGRRPRLSRRFDALLVERAGLLRELQDERTRREVDAIFVAPEDETSHGSGSPVPR